MEKAYYILISAVDNRMVVTLNEVIIYDSGLAYIPRILDSPAQVPVTRHLYAEKESLLIFDCYNGGASATDLRENPYHFAFRIVERSVAGDKDLIPPVVLKDVSKPGIWLPSIKYKAKKEHEAFVFREFK